MLKYLNRGISTPIALTIIIVLAVVLIGGVFAYQYYYLPKQETEAPKVETPKDETADWNFYRNLTYDYEIKYPKIWTASKNTYKIPEEGDWLKEFSSPDFGDFRFTIYALSSDKYLKSRTYEALKENAENEPVAVCLAGHCSENPSVNYKEFELNNFKVFQREIVHNDFPGPAIIIESYILRGEFFFELVFFHGSHYSINEIAPEVEITPEDRKLNDQMLSTFKFID